MRADSRADAVGADQQIAALAGSVLEYRSDARGVLFDPAQFLAEPIVLRRQCIAQRPIQPRPGAHGSRGRLFDHDFAGAVETHDLRHRDAHSRIEGDASAAQSGDELRMCSETDATSGQRCFVALEHHGVPVRTAKKVRRQ